MNLVKEFNNQKNDNMRMQYMLSTAFNVTMDEMNEWKDEENDRRMTIGVRWIKHIIDAGCIQSIAGDKYNFSFKVTKKGNDFAY